MPKLKKILVPIALILGVAQFIPNDPPAAAADSTDALIVQDENVRSILQKACYDCHSNETHYPWYSNVVPLNYWLYGHIEHGREHLNFSAWNAYPHEDRKHMVKEIAEVVKKKEMPMLSYWLVHWDAKLTDEERQALTAYFENL